MVLQHSARKSITQEELKSWLTYNPESGIFHWRNREDLSPQWNGRFAGKVAGSINRKGYRIINIEGKMFKAHRLVFMYLGEDVPEYVDHIDMDKDNNRRSNLRSATNSENVANNIAYSTNTSGYKNVSWAKDRNQWYVKVIKDGAVYGGYFEILSDAVAHANKMRKILFGEFAFFEEFRGE